MKKEKEARSNMWKIIENKTWRVKKKEKKLQKFQIPLKQNSFYVYFLT